jgi:hypothetical protein
VSRKAIHEEIYQSPLSTHGFINSLSELKGLVKPRTRAPTAIPRGHGNDRWIPPPHPVPEIHVDAAVSKSSVKGVAPTICRNEQGLYLGASALIFPGITDPAILEALACQDALALVAELVSPDSMWPLTASK